MTSWNFENVYPKATPLYYWIFSILLTIRRVTRTKNTKTNYNKSKWPKTELLCKLYEMTKSKFWIHIFKISQSIIWYLLYTVKPWKWRIFSLAKIPSFAKTAIFEAVVCINWKHPCLGISSISGKFLTANSTLKWLFHYLSVLSERTYNRL